MDTMAPIRPAVRRSRRIALSAGPAAAGDARRRVRAAICAWGIPVDPSVAALLTSELVTNAITHETGETITLVITFICGQLRVDVRDTSCAWPAPADAPVDVETGRGLMLVASLSTDWGFYRTAEGKAVYFTLAFQDDPALAGDHRPEGNHRRAR